MKPFYLNTISNEIDIVNRDGLALHVFTTIISMAVFVGLFFLFVFIWPNALPPSWCIIILFLMLIPIHRFIRRIQKDWVSLKKCTGKVEFTEKEIKTFACEKPVELNNITTIKLTGDYHQGYVIGGSKDVTHNGLYHIILSTKNEEQFSFKFVVFNKQEFEDLSRFFEFLYGNFAIDINEKIGIELQKGFILRHDRNYKDIQDLKQKIALSNKAT